jgi:ankyrin repeat-rich membrane spanning protein
VNAKDSDSWSPLLNVCYQGNLYLAEKLLNRKALIESRDSGGFTPLMWACYRNHVRLVRFLIQHNADVNAQCKNSMNCLSWAAGRGHFEVVKELLEVSNLKLNAQDRHGSTALLWAARKGHLPICEALVEKGADTELIGMNNMSPLVISCKFKHEELAFYLAKQITQANCVNQVDKNGENALYLATKHSFVGVVLMLLEKRAYVNILNRKGNSALITAVKNGNKTIVG